MKNYGTELHNFLMNCFRNNPSGRPYSSCHVIREFNKGESISFWVKDSTPGGKCTVLEKKESKAFQVSIKEAKGPGKIWCICVDDCLIENRGPQSPPRIDNFLFDETTFWFVEAKMAVSSSRTIEDEIKEAIELKFPRTKQILFDRAAEQGETISLKDIRLAIPFPGSNYSVPRNSEQRLEKLRIEAQKKMGIGIKKFSLSDTIEFGV